MGNVCWLPVGGKKLFQTVHKELISTIGHKTLYFFVYLKTIYVFTTALNLGFFSYALTDFYSMPSTVAFMEILSRTVKVGTGLESMITKASAMGWVFRET